MAERAIVAVLAGGRGRRIGGHKAITPLAGAPLLWRPLAAARGAGLEAVVVAKRDTALPALLEPVIYEPEHPHHPLCGALSALELAARRVPAPAVLLLGCDMPFLTSSLLAWLAGLDGAAMAEVGGRPQPLLARCLPAQLAVLRAALKDGLSMRAALTRLAPRIVEEHELSRFGDPERLCFNVNDELDLRLAERWLRRERRQGPGSGPARR